jgi:hypothetical protein
LLVGSRTSLGSGFKSGITDPDPNLQIISDPAGSGCTTLVSIDKIWERRQCFKQEKEKQVKILKKKRKKFEKHRRKNF